MVFAGLFPTDADDYPELRDALEKLKLNDAVALLRARDLQALGFGFRCGFLGLLHMEIVQERLEREFDLDLLVTAPTSPTTCARCSGEDIEVDNPAELPDATASRTSRSPSQGLDDRPEGVRRRGHGALQERRGEFEHMEYLSRDARAARSTSCRSPRSCSTSTTS